MNTETYEVRRVSKVEVAFFRFRVKLPMEDSADRAEDRLMGLLKSIDSANSFGNAYRKSAGRIR
jgi:hypothetical protein